RHCGFCVSLDRRTSRPFGCCEVRRHGNVREAARHQQPAVISDDANPYPTGFKKTSNLIHKHLEFGIDLRSETVTKFVSELVQPARFQPTASCAQLGRSYLLAEKIDPTCCHVVTQPLRGGLLCAVFETGVEIDDVLAAL